MSMERPVLRGIRIANLKVLEGEHYGMSAASTRATGLKAGAAKGSKPADRFALKLQLARARVPFVGRLEHGLERTARLELADDLFGALNVSHATGEKV